MNTKQCIYRQDKCWVRTFYGGIIVLDDCVPFADPSGQGDPQTYLGGLSEADSHYISSIALKGWPVIYPL